MRKYDMKVRLDALLAILNYSFAPTPIKIFTSLVTQNAFSIRLDDDMGFKSTIYYHLDTSTALTDSDLYNSLLNEVKGGTSETGKEIINGLKAFTDKVPYKMWFIEDAPKEKQLLLPPFENVESYALVDEDTRDLLSHVNNFRT